MIAIVLRTLCAGGAEQLAIRLSSAIGSRDQPVRIFTLYPAQFDDVAIKDGVSVCCLRQRSPLGFPISILRLLFEFVRNRPKVVLTLTQTGNVLAIPVALILRIPVIGTMLGIDHSAEKYGRKYHWVHQVEMHLLRFARVVLSNSLPTSDYLRQHGISRSKQVLAPGGVDAKRFRPDQNVRRKLRDLMGYREEHVVIGLVGRLDPVKAHDWFLKSAGQASVRDPNLRFIAIGDGSASAIADLYKKASECELSRSVFQHVPSFVNPLEIYNGLDILTMCSASEGGMPYVVGEAMACEVPCVVSDVGEAKDTVGETGVVLLNHGDVQEMQDAWRLLMDSRDRHERGRTARDRIERHFGWQRTTRAIAPALQHFGIQLADEPST